MIENLTYSYTIVEKDRYSNKYLSQIEKKCISQINKRQLINTRGGESIISRIDHFGDKHLIQFFK